MKLFLIQRCFGDDSLGLTAYRRDVKFLQLSTHLEPVIAVSSKPI
ncbi:hypothetical protein VINE108274_23895 [Vibrio neptunius]